VIAVHSKNCQVIVSAPDRPLNPKYWGQSWKQLKGNTSTSHISFLAVQFPLLLIWCFCGGISVLAPELKACLWQRVTQCCSFRSQSIAEVDQEIQY
jgi:hypothetical protein